LRQPYARPFLGISRDTIEDYAHAKGFMWREDRTNQSDNYRRNELRHWVLPRLKNIQPTSWEGRMANTFAYLRADQSIFSIGIRQLMDKCINEYGHILRDQLPSDEGQAMSLLRHLFRFWRFSPEQLRQLLVAKTGTRLQDKEGTGGWAVVYGNEIRLYREKGAIPSLIQIDALPFQCLLDQQQFLVQEGDPSEWDEPISAPDRLVAYLAHDAVKLPLTLRHWQAGDRFQPFGMQGKSKKLQDFFTDLKLDRLEKDRAWLLCNADGNILWVVGHRLSELARVEDHDELVVRAVIGPKREPVAR
ncbi:MAG: tRNA lysidine(34) synthetase TilS, partial [Bacteroidota bacterium]